MNALTPPILLSVPHLQQPSDGDCLPACVYMILSYYERRVRFWRLRRLLATKSFGTPFSNLQQLESGGVKVTLETRGDLSVLHRYLVQNIPCIASVQTEHLPYWTYNTLHAVVVVGIDSSQIYLNDPELPEAPVAVPLGDFDLAWLAQDERYAVLQV
ncbi:MAG: C39 family peptidase [Caldilineaceae bacterium]|nr:C39 family peptidase [Caldilineaceae bacterium]MCB0125512.1 C39 family peptidase [Caldilineaceae bacterium]